MSITSDAKGSDHALRQRAEAVGLGLQRAVGALLDELGAAGVRDQKSLQGALQLSQSAVSRLVSSVRSGDPLATLCSIPGQEALRQMLRGASTSVGNPACLREAERAIDAFEGFVDTEIGDRTTLDAVLSDWVHESRASFELRHKAAAFKSMSALRGVQADVVFTTGIVHPSADPARHDCIGLDGVLGCRRTRPSGVLHLFGYTLVPEANDRITGLAGQPVSAMPDLMLREYSTLPASAVDTVVHGGVMQTSVRGLPLGKTPLQGADLVCAQWLHGVHRAYRGDGAPSSGVGGQAEPPAAVYIVDALLHDDVWPGVSPELRLYDTVVRGVAHPDDGARGADRLDMLEQVQYLGRGADAFRMPEYPRYAELVRHACQAAGWDPAQLRGYRCRVRYPVYGSQIGLAFTLPGAPAQPASAG